MSTEDFNKKMYDDAIRFANEKLIDIQNLTHTQNNLLDKIEELNIENNRLKDELAELKEDCTKACPNVQLLDRCCETLKEVNKLAETICKSSECDNYYKYIYPYDCQFCEDIEKCILINSQNIVNLISKLNLDLNE